MTLLPKILKWATPKEKRDVYLVPLADLHTGSTMALFPYWLGNNIKFPLHPKMMSNGEWRFKHRDYALSERQAKMFQHFTKCAEVIAEERRGKQLIIIQNGDSIDGSHHDTEQLVSKNINEQIAVHVWLMQYFMDIVGFDKDAGDLLYIGAGTETHTQDNEDTISFMLNANKLPSGDDVFDFLPMNIKGKEFWFLHQGAGVGGGINKSGSATNWMKNKYVECLEDRRVVPDVVISGHFHKPHHATWTGNYKTMNYIVLPPFQLKTRYGFSMAAAELDKVGIQTIEVSTDGELKINPPMLLKEYPETVVIE